MPRRNYVCMYNECMLCLRIYRPKRYNARMYVCMYVITYVYEFTESNATTRYYVFHKLYSTRCKFSVLKVTDKIAIMTGDDR